MGKQNPKRAKLLITEKIETKKLLFETKLKTKLLIVLITIGVSTFFHIFRFSNREDISSYAVQLGSIWPHKTLVAEYSFPIYKNWTTYQKEIEKAKEKVLPVFISIENSNEAFLRRFDSLYQKFLNTNFSESTFDEVAPNFPFRSFFTLQSPEKFNEIQRAKALTLKFATNVLSKGLIDVGLKNVRSTEISVVSKSSNTERIVPKRYLYDKERFVDDLRNNLFQGFKTEVVEFFVELSTRAMVYSLVFSNDLTQRRIQLAELSVPKTIGYVKAGEVIVEKGKILTEDILLKLQSYERVRLLGKGERSNWLMVLGSFFTTLAIYLIIFIYIIILRKRIFADDFQFGLINACFLLIGFLSWLSVVVTTEIPLRFLIFLPSISILIAIVFDSRTAFYSTVTFAMLVASIRGNDFETAVALMLAGVIGAYSVRDIQSRTQMFRSMVFVEIGIIIPLIAFHLQKATSFASLIESVGLASLNSILSPIVSYGLLFIIEKISNITTDLKLKEFDDVNHPLLKKLSQNAPGTYQHTLAMALLAESCAEAIGANRLLTRVGAYFHDIGKLYKPEYFVENQIDFENKHEFISAKRSAELIREHVTKGIELAKEYNLPSRIIDFIPMHHGTSLIKHFYAKALEDSQGELIDETEFRYPGPKPNSKETTIVMICDSAEAMSRLHFKSKEELSASIEKMIMDKLVDGQFDESDISVKDLKTIQEVCVRLLYGIIHTRVEYKEIPDDKVKKANEQQRV